MADILWVKVFTSISFLAAVVVVLSALLILAEKKILNYGTCIIDINSGKKKLQVQGGSSLLSLLSDNNIFIPSACGGRGSCAYCKVRVEEGAGMIGPVELPSLSKDEVERNVRLSCQVKVRNDIFITIPDELFLVKKFKAVLERKRPLTHDIVELRLKLVEPSAVEFSAGQYIQISSRPYKGRESVNRAYSMSSPPSDSGHIELITRLVPEGICTTWIFEHLAEGDEVTLSGPYGEFCLRDTDAPIVFIAGGSGMAPIWSMLRNMREKGINRKAYYFFGALTQKDLFFTDELAKMQEDMPGFSFVPALSNEPEGSGWKGAKGLITDVVKNTIPDLKGFEAYLCGSPGMINACIAMLTKSGIPEDKIYYDKFA